MSCVLNAVRSDGRKDGQATSCHGKDLEGELLSLSTVLPYRFHIIFHPHPPAKTLHLDSPRSVSQDFSDSQDKAQGQRDEKTQRSESEIWWATFFCAGIRCLCLLANQCVEMIWDDFGVIIPEAANDERFHALPVFFKFMFVSRNQKISIHSTHSGPLVTWHLGGWSLIVPMNCCRRRSWANVTQRSCF